MSAKGFGQPQPSKTDKLVEQVVRYCQKRNPEALDQIFDNLPVGRTVQEYQRLNQQILAGTTNALTGDIDTLAWFCGYIASEINRSEDNQKSHHPIILLSKLLIKHGIQPFTDFSPGLNMGGAQINIFSLTSKSFIGKWVATEELTFENPEDAKINYTRCAL